jgi:hypothetical protein
MLTPNTRLPNCLGVPCIAAGNGNGILDNTPNLTPIAAEGERFFVHLNAANLLTNIVLAAGAPGNAFGGNYPEAKISGNGFQASSSTGAIGNFTAIIGGTVPNSGLYLTLISAIGVPGAATVGLKPDEALDTKIDDGAPDTGNVRAFGAAGPAGCGQAGAPGVAGVYATNITSAQCGLYIHIQG